MKTLILQFVILGLAIAAFADDLQNRSIATNQETIVGQKLEAFDKGQITWDNLTDSQESCSQLVKYYWSHTNEVTTKMKLPISRGFNLLGSAPAAAKLVEEYIGVYSNDWRGWRVLGGARLMMKSYDQAIIALTNAAKLGDEENYAGLGLAALAGNRPDVFESLVAPHLLIMMNDVKRFPNDQERFKMRCLLISYAIIEDKKGVFVNAIEGLPANRILADERLKNQVAYGCQIFKGPDIDKIRKEMESATSSTNGVSSPPR